MYNESGTIHINDGLLRRKHVSQLGCQPGGHDACMCANLARSFFLRESVSLTPPMS
jgi:hypothetical protein